VLARKALGELRVHSHVDALQEGLRVVGDDALGQVLLGEHLSVE
jgi:hypothetical protein